MATNTCMDTCVPCCGGSRDSAFPCTTRTRAIAAAIYPLLCCRGDWITKEKCVCVCMYPDGIIQGPLLLKDDSSLSLFFCISFLSCLSPTHLFSASFHCPHCPNHAFFPLSFSIAPLLSFFKSYVCSFIISHFFLNSEYYSLFVSFLHSSCH